MAADLSGLRVGMLNTYMGYASNLVNLMGQWDKFAAKYIATGVDGTFQDSDFGVAPNPVAYLSPADQAAIQATLTTLRASITDDMMAVLMKWSL